jgi:hypothetical protein
MVGWFWLIPAFIAGEIFTVFILALVSRNEND